MHESRVLLAAAVLAFALADRVYTQTYRVDATVTRSAQDLRNGCNRSRVGSLPLGPVSAPVQSTITLDSLVATSAVVPQIPSSPLTIQNSCTAFVPGSCVTGLATSSLWLDLTISSPTGGVHWLRVLWNERREAAVGVLPASGSHEWTLFDRRTNSTLWKETRPSLNGLSLYLDVPVDLTTPALLSVRLEGRASSEQRSVSVYSGSTDGTMTFALRQNPPVPIEGYGVPCPTSKRHLPVAVGYDPFATGHGHLLAVFHSTEFFFRPTILWLGLSRDRFGSLSLPLDLGPYGAPSCFLLQDLALALPSFTDSVGLAIVPLARPQDLKGLPPIYFQWIAPDSANALGLVFSNGVKLQVP